jgi:hypothetical protein
LATQRTQAAETVHDHNSDTTSPSRRGAGAPGQLTGMEIKPPECHSARKVAREVSWLRSLSTVTFARMKRKTVTALARVAAASLVPVTVARTVTRDSDLRLPVRLGPGAGPGLELHRSTGRGSRRRLIRPRPPPSPHLHRSRVVHSHWHRDHGWPGHGSRLP